MKRRFDTVDRDRIHKNKPSKNFHRAPDKNMILHQEVEKEDETEGSYRDTKCKCTGYEYIFQ